MRHNKTPVYCWDATLSCDATTTDHNAIINELKQIAKTWCFQLESPITDPCDSYSDDYDTEDAEFDALTFEDANVDDRYDEDDLSAESESEPEDIFQMDFDFSESDSDSYSSDSEDDYENQGSYQHFQIRFSLIKKKRKRELLNMLKENNFLLQKAYFSPCSNNSLGNLLYVMKADSRIAGPWSDKDVQQTNIPQHIKNIKLWKWQQELLDRVKYNRSNRHIHLVYCPKGNTGKSTLTMYAKVYNFMNAKMIPSIMDSFLDCNQAVLCQVNDSKEEPQLFFLDIPRALPKKSVTEILAFCESLKSCFVFDKRYRYQEYVFKQSPEIVIFSNILFPKDLLSSDRLQLWTIKDKQLVTYPDLKTGVDINYPFNEHPIRLRWWSIIDALTSLDDSENSEVINQVDCKAEGELLVTSENEIII